MLLHSTLILSYPMLSFQFKSYSQAFGGYLIKIAHYIGIWLGYKLYFISYG